MKTVARRKDGRPVFSTNQVMKRKEIFRGRLFDIVKSHHKVYNSWYSQTHCVQ